MTGRHGQEATDNSSPSAPADTAAHDVATMIAGLRWRLRQQEIFEHPQVLSALRALQEQVEEQLKYADQRPGRHRLATAKDASQQVTDAVGLDQKPDPLRATTAAEFVQILRDYKQWSGNPSWRTMAKRANQIVVHSTMHSAMSSNTLPKFEVMKAIVIGCGGGEEDLKTFASAWRRIGGRVTLT